MLNDNLGNPRLRMAVRLALTGGSLAATFGVANAQTAPAAASPDTSLQEVVVTGSRISVPNQVSISPVTFVSALDVQQSGVTRVEDLLNELPQVFAAQGANISNGATGTAEVDLRGLGAKRTLVLVNGLRLGPGDPRTGGSSDINMIPAEMIDSIEVLTGGASSTYGADAVGGVVNFKLNDHFEGVKIVADAGIYNHSNKNTEGVEDAVAAAHFQEAPSSVNTGAQKSLSLHRRHQLRRRQGQCHVLRHLSKCRGHSGRQVLLQRVYAQFRICDLELRQVLLRRLIDWVPRPLCDHWSGRAGQQQHHRAEWHADSVHGGRRSTISARSISSSGPDERYTAGAFLHYDFNEHALGLRHDHVHGRQVPRADCGFGRILREIRGELRQSISLAARTHGVVRRQHRGRDHEPLHRPAQRRRRRPRR